MPAEPDWLTVARREGRILSETGVQPPVLAEVKKKPTVRTNNALLWTVEIVLPCRVVSEANRRDHWTAAAKRKNEQADVLRSAFAELGLSLPLPVTVTWCHVHKPGTREQDDDNLRRSFKGLRDVMASLLGVDDADPRVAWEYTQQTGKPGVKILVGKGNT